MLAQRECQHDRLRHQYRHPQVAALPAGSFHEPVEVELTFTELLDQFDAGDHRGSVGKALEAQHPDAH